MMISYAFDQRLVPLIQAGVVCATFRAPSLRHARPGERIRLTDRTTFSAIIPDPICTHVARCEVSWVAGHITAIRQDGIPVIWSDRFAEALGYRSFAELEDSWAAELEPTFLEGFIIEWAPPQATSVEVAA